MLKQEPVITSVLLVVIMGWSGYVASLHAPHPVFTVVTSVSCLVVYLVWKFSSTIRLSIVSQAALAVPALCSMGLYALSGDNDALFMAANVLGLISFLGIPVFFLKSRRQ